MAKGGHIMLYGAAKLCFKRHGSQSIKWPFGHFMLYYSSGHFMLYFCTFGQVMLLSALSARLCFFLRSPPSYVLRRVVRGLSGV